MDGNRGSKEALRYKTKDKKLYLTIIQFYYLSDEFYYLQLIAIVIRNIA